MRQRVLDDMLTGLPEKCKQILRQFPDPGHKLTPDNSAGAKFKILTSGSPFLIDFTVLGLTPRSLSAGMFHFLENAARLAVGLTRRRVAVAMVEKEKEKEKVKR
jgi:hypothetical protein